METGVLLYQVYSCVLVGYTIYQKYEQIKYCYSWIKYFTKRKLFHHHHNNNNNDNNDNNNNNNNNYNSDNNEHDETIVEFYTSKEKQMNDDNNGIISSSSTSLSSSSSSSSFEKIDTISDSDLNSVTLPPFDNVLITAPNSPSFIVTERRHKYSILEDDENIFYIENKSHQEKDNDNWMIISAFDRL